MVKKDSDSSSESEFDPTDQIPREEIETIETFLESFVLSSGGGSREN